MHFGHAAAKKKSVFASTELALPLLHVLIYLCGLIVVGFKLCGIGWQYCQIGLQEARWNPMSNWKTRDLHGSEQSRSVFGWELLLAASSDERHTWGLWIQHGFLCVSWVFFSRILLLEFSVFTADILPITQKMSLFFSIAYSLHLALSISTTTQPSCS